MADVIVDLDELVPADIVFKYRGGEYRLPGDPSQETVLELIRDYRDLLAAEQADDEATIEKVGKRSQGTLLKLFQEEDSAMTELPFGTFARQHVVRAVLTTLGLLVEVTPPDPPRPQPRRTTSVKTKRKKSGSSTRSRR